MNERYPPPAAAAEQKKSRRRPGSFVIKLTLGQSLRMLRLMVIIDLLVVAAFLLVQFSEMERVTTSLVQMSGEEFAGAVQFLPDVVLAEEPEGRYGILLDSRIEQLLGATPGASRVLQVVPRPGEPFLWKSWEVGFEYIVCAPAGQDRFLVATFDITASCLLFAKAMTLILAVEGVLLISHTAGARRAIRKTLAPIQQLTAAARTAAQPKRQPPPMAPGKTAAHKPYLQQAVQGYQQARRSPGEKELSGTINALNRITAGRLDARIPIEGERNELHGLASAINSMLDRVDSAYSSQLRFVSDASHELRTPIAVLQGYANMLDRWGKEDPAVLQESIEAIKAESEGMKVLVEQLLFLARGDNNTIALKVQPLSVAELVEDAVRDARIIDSDHEFEEGVPADLVLDGDIGLLKQALRIFVDNAVKYSPDGGKIRIQASQDAEWLRISVTDNGIGIPDEDLPHVFERFFRSDESRARATGGTGLGLSIAQWIVERHGGFLEITSREELGTRMTMVLPVGGNTDDGDDAENDVDAKHTKSNADIIDAKSSGAAQNDGSRTGPAQPVKTKQI